MGERVRVRGESEKRRALRQRSTQAEQLLWAALRNRRFHSLKFRRQHELGPYITDFTCVEKSSLSRLTADTTNLSKSLMRVGKNSLKSLGTKCSDLRQRRC